MLEASYTSLSFLLLFLPAVIIGYSLVPQRARPYLLLGASYFFFWAISGILTICILSSTITIYYSGQHLSLLTDKRKADMKNPGELTKKEIKALYKKRMRRLVAFVVIMHLVFLAFYKYTGFAVFNLNAILRFLGTDTVFAIPEFVAPIGISFYTMQAMGYMFDVYREKTPACKNFFQMALFMSFFPQIVEGPICRYTDTAEQLWAGKRIERRDLMLGVQRIAYGIFKKIMIADRVNLFVRRVFDGYDRFDGGVFAVGAVFYTLELYMDFSGCMDIVCGVAQIFGVKMPENFRQPFFSKSISDFWTRWHITLGAWFRDNIFYPMAVSGPLKKLTTNARKKIGNHFGPLTASAVALFCVWLSNGIWHGAGWQFIFYGMYHFVFILGGNIIEPWAIKATQKLHINRACLPYRIFQIIRTCIVVFVGEMFFRAEGLSAGFTMFKRLFTDMSFSSIWNIAGTKMGIDSKDLWILLVSVLIIFTVSILREKKIPVREWLIERPVYVQIPIYYAFIMLIVIFGGYGAAYAPVDPMYASF